jgi:putative transposase
MIEIMYEECFDIESLLVKDMVSVIEQLIYGIKYSRTLRYKVCNQRFYKFPFYLRCLVIGSVFGKVKSYRSNYKNWEEEKKLVELERV